MTATAPLIQQGLAQLDLLLSVIERVEGLLLYERERQDGVLPGHHGDLVVIADSASLALRVLADELREQLS
jgi:hypothetical protein